MGKLKSGETVTLDDGTVVSHVLLPIFKSFSDGDEVVLCDVTAFVFVAV